jgi:hypothetical protein
MTKQEQRYKIVITLINKGFGPKPAVQFANDIMAEMYGKDWESQPEVEYIPGCGCQHAETFHPLIAEKEDCPNFERVPIVSIAEQDGQKGVRFCIGDVDMFIEAHDLDDGKEYEWPDAMKRLKEVGKETFTHKQGLLMAAYRDEINAALREIGGDEMKGYYWTSTERSTDGAWDVYFVNGRVYYNCKDNSLAVRACAAFKHE